MPIVSVSPHRFYAPSTAPLPRFSSSHSPPLVKSGHTPPPTLWWQFSSYHWLPSLFLIGYRKHQKRWSVVSALIGIFFILGGALLPAITNGTTSDQEIIPTKPSAENECNGTTSNSGCESCHDNALEDSLATTGSQTCVDGCCPSIQVSESGQTSLHIPPAAIVTTLGGVFLIAAHIGNLRSGTTCLNGNCRSCEC